MKTHDFYFDLPPELIAQTPLQRRDGSRLLTLDKETGRWAHRHFYELPDLLRPEWQATMGRVISALNYYGIDHSDIIVYTEGHNATLPKCCILMEKMGLYCHYLVHYDGKFYDSNLGVIPEYDMSKLLGYLEVKVD